MSSLRKFRIKVVEYDDMIELSVPRLMVLGILYCGSSAKERAEKLYDLVQLDLEPLIDTTDIEFKDFFALIGQFCYIIITKHYNKFV